MNIVTRLFLSGFCVGANLVNIFICLLIYGFSHNLLFALCGLASTIGAVVEWNVYSSLKDIVVIKEGEPNEPKPD